MLTYQDLIEFLSKKDIEAHFNVLKNPDFDPITSPVPLKMIENLQKNGLITLEEMEMLKLKINDKINETIEGEKVLNQKTDCGFSTFVKQDNLCNENSPEQDLTYSCKDFSDFTLNIPSKEENNDKNNTVELTNALLGVLGKVLPGKVGAAVTVVDLLKNGDLKEEIQKGKGELNKLLNSELANKVKNLDILNDANVKEKLKQGEDFLGGLFSSVKEKASSVYPSNLVKTQYDKQNFKKQQDENFLLLKEIKMSLIDILNNQDFDWNMSEKLDGDFLKTHLLRTDNKISFYLNCSYFSKTVFKIIVEKKNQNDTITLVFKDEDLSKEQKEDFETLKFHLLNKIKCLNEKEKEQNEKKLKEKAKLFLDDL